MPWMQYDSTHKSDLMTELTEALSIFATTFLGLITVTTAVAARNLRMLNSNTSSWKRDDLIAIKHAVESAPMVSQASLTPSFPVEIIKKEENAQASNTLIADFEKRLEEILRSG